MTTGARSLFTGKCQVERKRCCDFCIQQWGEINCAPEADIHNVKTHCHTAKGRQSLARMSQGWENLSVANRSSFILKFIKVKLVNNSTAQKSPQRVQIPDHKTISNFANKHRSRSRGRKLQAWEDEAGNDAGTPLLITGTLETTRDLLLEPLKPRHTLNWGVQAGSCKEIQSP